ncbi:capsule assembly Wzi family protein [Psychrobacter sanguinis]|uniref:capsule assembly Wzi family protein n=1 Tax=Psychrobacter sanguinis TaxID=861445 RepID=UPI00020C7A30|nr:capsule assembly Wzi family protein [Psychrobacter sanguinis]EGK13944.1 surface assembly of capsule [Psychrobacter sp. 1501(2011)]MCD9150517.1 capsule assembly Wzi family protein [Psychrobacter sanguinis]
MTNLTSSTFKFVKLTTLALGISLTSVIAIAQNLQMNDLSLKSELDWLQAQGVIQISTSTWPLTANEINRALESANVRTPEQQQIVQSIRYTLNKQPKSLVNTTLSAYGQTDRKQLPQTFADDKLANFEASARAGISEDDWEINLQANIKDEDIDDKDVSFDGSYVAGKYANQWLIAGQIPTWWGPGHDGSLIRGDASKPVIGLTMQRDKQSAPTSQYLSWIGPWQYQLFAGQLDDYKAIPDTKLIGIRLTSSPTSWLEVGASRTFMWGGEGKSQSLSSFFDALTGSKDNVDNKEDDISDQLAGFDARINLAPLTNLPIGIYGQYVGEDEAGYLPSKNMYLAGADFASSINTDSMGSMPYQLYTEWTDTRTGGDVRGISYNHYVYTDGNYQYGYPLGYALGGDTESIAVGGKLWIDSQNFINTKMQYAKVNQSSGRNNKAFPESDKLKVLDVAWEHQLNPKTTISSRAWVSDSDIHSTDVGGGIGVEFNNF